MAFSEKKKLIVFLDLDETLISAHRGSVDSLKKSLEKQITILEKMYQRSFAETFQKNIQVKRQSLRVLKKSPVVVFPDDTYVIIKRPKLYTFFQKLYSFADIYILSAGSLDYVKKVVRALGINPYLEDVFSSRQSNDLSFAKDQIWVLVDDLGFGSIGVQNKLHQITGEEDPSLLNYIQIRPFTGSADGELMKIYNGIYQKMKKQGQL